MQESREHAEVAEDLEPAPQQIELPDKGSMSAEDESGRDKWISDMMSELAPLARLVDEPWEGTATSKEGKKKILRGQ